MPDGMTTDGGGDSSEGDGDNGNSNEGEGGEEVTPPECVGPATSRVGVDSDGNEGNGDATRPCRSAAMVDSSRLHRPRPI